MGIDTSHECWHGRYSAFSCWRDQLAKTPGTAPEWLLVELAAPSVGTIEITSNRYLYKPGLRCHRDIAKIQPHSHGDIDCRMIIRPYFHADITVEYVET